MSSFALRAAFIGFEILMVAALLAVWFGIDAVRASRSLWVLFFYSFPSQFLMAIVPHEPVEVFFAKFYPPLTVALVSVSGVVLTEMVNYSVVHFFSDLAPAQRVVQGRFVQALVRLFKKAPFTALWVAGITPVPFYPFRFLVVWADYPWWKYALAVLASRTPRYYLIALAGRAMRVPNWILIGAFVVMGATFYVPLLWRKLRQRRGPEAWPPRRLVQTAIDPRSLDDSP